MDISLEVYPIFRHTHLKTTMTGGCGWPSQAHPHWEAGAELEPLSTPLSGNLPLHSLTTGKNGGETSFTSSLISNIKVTNLRTKLFQSTYRSSKYPPNKREGLGISSNYIGKLGLWLVVSTYPSEKLKVSWEYYSQYMGLSENRVYSQL